MFTDNASVSTLGAIPAAAYWLQATLLGTVATTLAVVCVASVGLAMLNGRVDVRRGVAVIAGCFVLFASTWIAAGLRSLTDPGDGVLEFAATPPPIPSPPELPPPPPQTRDPYAGAALHF
ncbi:TrbC/VirB2 family protein [Sphingomonas sp.]|uniref:TrbC/VirB2 family protein n=1 Tax=Sphingomonas sp. TaxID=28214 RepID=UPI001B0C0CE7|nr:TrbC/VirB2 family protein [Sphingomonas sp.]MBO9715178.1 TrbC/VirB2 family protein [Sphingomonas sp.]